MTNNHTDLNQLSRRERQIMEVVYREKQASTREVQDKIEDPPSYSATRASMRILVEKGFLAHVKKNGRYIFTPTVQPEKAKRSAIHRVVETFFESSASKVMSTLLSSDELSVDDEELDRLESLIAEARRKKGDKK